jgi:hypothetical protein
MEDDHMTPVDVQRSSPPTSATLSERGFSVPSTPQQVALIPVAEAVELVGRLNEPTERASS